MPDPRPKCQGNPGDADEPNSLLEVTRLLSDRCSDSQVGREHNVFEPARWFPGKSKEARVCPARSGLRSSCAPNGAWHTAGARDACQTFFCRMLTASSLQPLSLALLPAYPPGDLVATIPRQASGWFGSHTCLTPGDPGTPHGDLPHLYQQVIPRLPRVLSSGLSFSGTQRKP